MLQIYFFSVIFIMFTGMILSCVSFSTKTSALKKGEDVDSDTAIGKAKKTKKKEEKNFREYLKFDAIFHVDVFLAKGVKLFFGIGAAFLGLLLILSVNKGDIAIIGDIIPALLGIVGGVVLILISLGKETYSGKNKYLKWTFTFLSTNVNILGLLMLIMGFLHIFFPLTPLL